MSLKNFEILQKLGEGSFSKVYKVKSKATKELLALKQVRLGPLSSKEKENALNEVRILASIHHENIIAYKEAFIDEDSRTLCVVMEFAENGDVLMKINHHKQNRTYFSEQEIWDCLVQVTLGIKALHDMRIMHRDLKCANIFIGKNGKYKLGDLNVSKVMKSGMARTQTGTPYYASPEVWRDQPYNYSSDIWSLGCVIYEMTAKTPPFLGKDMRSLYNKVVQGAYPPIPPRYSNDLSNVIRSLLQVNPSYRPSCEKILQMPPVQRHIESRKYELSNSSSQLLGTIKFEPSVRVLNQKLPKLSEERNRLISSRANSVDRNKENLHTSREAISAGPEGRRKEYEFKPQQPRPHRKGDQRVLPPRPPEYSPSSNSSERDLLSDDRRQRNPINRAGNMVVNSPKAGLPRPHPVQGPRLHHRYQESRRKNPSWWN